MMTDNSADLYLIAKRLAILTKQLKGCTDPEERRVLLKEFRILLGEADRITAAETLPE
jgi:hypothetical protein